VRGVGVPPVILDADPSEPRYCYCNQVSYGEMIGCDNDDCPLEWFHLSCAGLTSAPTGKWLCNVCKPKLKGGLGKASGSGASKARPRVKPKAKPKAGSAQKAKGR